MPTGESKDSERVQPFDEENEPAEMTSLRLELSTLATSHASMQNTLQLLHTELTDLKRVNNELQEENESYNILLREKTLTGRFDLLRGASGGSDDGDDGDSRLSFAEERDGPPASMRSKSNLDAVPEADEPFGKVRDGSPKGSQSMRSSRRASPVRSRRGQVVRNGSLSPAREETLGDLPISGPGLDLAAELGRAENRNILEGGVDPSTSPKAVTTHKESNEDVRGMRFFRFLFLGHLVYKLSILSTTKRGQGSQRCQQGPFSLCI